MPFWMGRVKASGGGWTLEQTAAFPTLAVDDVGQAQVTYNRWLQPTVLTDGTVIALEALRHVYQSGGSVKSGLTNPGAVSVAESLPISANRGLGAVGPASSYCRASQGDYEAKSLTASYTKREEFPVSAYTFGNAVWRIASDAWEAVVNGALATALRTWGDWIGTITGGPASGDTDTTKPGQAAVMQSRGAATYLPSVDFLRAFPPYKIRARENGVLLEQLVSDVCAVSDGAGNRNIGSCLCPNNTTGSVLADPGNTAQRFLVAVSGSGVASRGMLKFTSGANANVSLTIQEGFPTNQGLVTMQSPFPATPAADDTFTITQASEDWAAETLVHDRSYFLNVLASTDNLDVPRQDGDLDGGEEQGNEATTLQADAAHLYFVAQGRPEIGGAYVPLGMYRSALSAGIPSTSWAAIYAEPVSGQASAWLSRPWLAVTGRAAWLLEHVSGTKSVKRFDKDAFAQQTIMQVALSGPDDADIDQVFPAWGSVS